MLAFALIAFGCGGRSALQVDARADAGDIVLASDGGVDAGRDAGFDAGADAGVDAGEPLCGWGPGLVGAWRVESDIDPDTELPALLHIDDHGSVRSSTLWLEPGDAFGMGVAVRGRELGASWRVRRDDGTNAIYFALVRGGCVVGEPTLVHEGDLVQFFRGNLVATPRGWLVFWTAEGGLWVRGLDGRGVPGNDARSVARFPDGRFSVATSGDRVAVLMTGGSTAQLIELDPGGAVLRTAPMADPRRTASEPRVIGLDDGWGGTFILGGELVAFTIDGALASMRTFSMGPACTACVTEPSYLLPAVATDGRSIGALWPRASGELVFAVADFDAMALRFEPIVVARGGDLRWPALGFDGARWVALVAGVDGQHVHTIESGAGEPGLTLTRGLSGTQRLPSLVRLPP